MNQPGESEVIPAAAPADDQEPMADGQEQEDASSNATPAPVEPSPLVQPDPAAEAEAAEAARKAAELLASHAAITEENQRLKDDVEQLQNQVKDFYQKDLDREIKELNQIHRLTEPQLKILERLGSVKEIREMVLAFIPHQRSPLMTHDPNAQFSRERGLPLEAWKQKHGLF